MLNLLLMTPQPGQNPLMTFAPLVLVFVVFYFFIIRPQQKRSADRTKLIDSLAKGEKIITVGGMYGTVVGFEGDNNKILLVEIAPRTLVKMERSAISSIIRGGVTTSAPAA